MDWNYTYNMLSCLWMQWIVKRMEKKPNLKRCKAELFRCTNNNFPFVILIIIRFIHDHQMDFKTVEFMSIRTIRSWKRTVFAKWLSTVRPLIYSGQIQYIFCITWGIRNHGISWNQLNNEIHKNWNSINIDETTCSNVVQCICHGVSSTIALYILN